MAARFRRGVDQACRRNVSMGWAKAAWVGEILVRCRLVVPARALMVAQRALGVHEL
jgi:hypothetical protein